MAADPGFKIFVVIMSGLFLGGATASVFSAVFLRRYLRYRNFPTVSGVLLRSEVTSTYSEGQSFWPRASYGYEVAGFTFESDRIFSLCPVGASRSWAVEFVGRLRRAPELKVYYDPARPGFAFLRNGPASMIFFTASFGLLFLPLVVFFTWPWLTRSW
jgi:hypothetical protein